MKRALIMGLLLLTVGSYFFISDYTHRQPRINYVFATEPLQFSQHKDTTPIFYILNWDSLIFPWFCCGMNYFPCFNSYIGYGCGGCIVYTDQLGWFPNNYNHINFPSQEVGFVIAEDSMQSQPVAKLDSSEIVLEDTMKVNQKVSWREKWKQFFSRKKSKAE